MTGQELINDLKASGTGESKLATANTLLKVDPKMTALQLYNALTEAGVGEGTLSKARSFMGVEAPPAPEVKLPPFPVRAPVGGATVGGKSFSAGQRIPGKLLEVATVDEIRNLHQDNEVMLREVERPASKPATPKSS